MHTCMHTLPLKTLNYFYLLTSKEKMYLFLTNQGNFSRILFSPLPFLVPKYSFTFLNHPMPSPPLSNKKKSYFGFKKKIENKIKLYNN